ncbi:hypothetical protein EJB05_15522, partial [Eragrostis curvula]
MTSRENNQSRRPRNPTLPSPATVDAAGLPDDPLVEILSRLPVKPLHRCKCVARSWRDLIDDPSNQKKLAQTLEGFFLMEDGDDGGHIDFVNLPARSVPLDIDLSFSFIKSLPGIEALAFLDSCNGLFLFKHHRKSAPRHVLGYIVCNPATKEWGAVPDCGCPPLRFAWSSYLVFDPAVSPHFHLILFRCEPQQTTNSTELRNILVMPHAYSSETGTWSHIPIDWNVEEEQGHLEEWRYCGREPQDSPRRAFVDGMLHLLVLHPDSAVAVDVQGNTRRIIRVPKVSLLRAIYYPSGFSRIMVLKSAWVLLDKINLLDLFGTKNPSHGKMELRFVAIHPDCNVVFLAQTSELKLMSYDMDRKEVSVVGTLGNLNDLTHIVPYVPYFSKSPVFKCLH